MPRGKNYVNNNKGVVLQASSKSKASMQLCSYGSACNRPDCIYRHETSGNTDEICLSFLAGMCNYKGGCRKRHPNKEESARLLARYKKTRCRFGDKCYTEGCLYLHPRDMPEKEPFYIEPDNVAFPPLNGATQRIAPNPVPNSAWKAAPPTVVPRVQSVAPTWQPAPVPPQAMPIPPSIQVHMDHTGESSQMMFPEYYYNGPQYSLPPGDYQQGSAGPQGTSPMNSFNVHAKEFTPGSMLQG